MNNLYATIYIYNKIGKCSSKILYDLDHSKVCEEDLKDLKDENSNIVIEYGERQLG